MKAHIYLKSTFTDIRQSLGRFISIILIIFMGVLLFVGIKAIGPNLEKTAVEYIDEYHLADFQVVSTLGLTEKDQDIVKQMSGATVELGYSLPVIEKHQNLALQVYSYQEEQKQNQLKLIEGRLPKSETEVVLDHQLATTYQLNDWIELEDDALKQQKFQVVGYVDSPMYIDRTERGVSNIGDGQLAGFAYLLQTVFISDTYTIMYVSFEDLVQEQTFSKEYNQLVAENFEALEKTLDGRKEERRTEVQNSVNQEIVTQETEIIANEQDLLNGQQELYTAKQTLENQKQQLQLMPQTEEVQAQLAANEQLLIEQQKELDENNQKIVEAKEQINEAKSELASMELPNYLVNSRSDNPGFTEYVSLSDRIDAIANVFPVFFFFIAILITFTTMTRMIEENRKEIGTLKALGYRKQEITSKYILYALIATVIGATAGIFVGSKLLPQVVFRMLSDQYIFSSYTTSLIFVPITLAIVLSLFSTLGSSLFVLSSNLNENTTALLSPKAPKAGQRVLLERVTFIWSKLNFNQKVTYRNLFRYKTRMMLTIFGIAGCTGLMLAGFGLNDSISAPAKKQFNEIMHYQAIVSLTTDERTEAEDKTQQILTDSSEIVNFCSIYSEQVTLRQKGIANQTVNLYVTDNPTEFDRYVSLQSSNHSTKEKLTNKGVIISQRLAKIYDVQAGDTLVVQAADGKESLVEVAGVTENYLSHYMYMTADYYTQVTENMYEKNTYLVQTKELNKQAENELSTDLLATNQVFYTTFLRTQIEKQEAATDNIGVVVLIFIILSGTLAFVVLYNLTTINVSERERELATMKVLGFYNEEVTMYIVRENIIFTFFGILFGFVIGKALTWFILAMASSDVMVFPLLISWQGYVLSAVMTIIFSTLVMIWTHGKLKTIDMIGALKSNE